MSRWVWIDPSIVSAIHDEQISEHGGATGVRDPGLLESALARPQNLDANGGPDVFLLAAAYAFGVAKYHPFVDGNKRTALVLCELFLELNGWRNEASDAETLAAMLDLAAGEIDEDGFAAWLRDGCVEG
ncbi:MAG: type II toxin-antitoxin system death-on-curing family toxin [Caulobacterales bacterium]